MTNNNLKFNISFIYKVRLFYYNELPPKVIGENKIGEELLLSSL